MPLVPSASGVITDGRSNPIYSHTLKEFIMAGKNKNNTIPTYDKLSYQQTEANITYVIKQILDDYLVELKRMSVYIQLSKEELKKYNYNPKRLCADVYGNTEMYYLILLLNGICNVKEFHDINPIRMIPIEILNEAISSIQINELDNIRRYNSRHV
jgi:hypothetical protein